MKVCILLAAYNGAAYIRQQIDSILQQDYPNIQLVLSDDGSQDGTQEILTEYEAKYPGRVIWHQSGKRFGKAQTHFMHLLRTFHDADYIMFSDQDDVWHPDKVRKTLQKMREIEKDTSVPALVHTDLRVVDRELNMIAPSFCSYSDIDGSRLQLNQMLVQDVVTGCTMMVNHALASLADVEIPDDAVVMHDWWLGILAAACGTAGFLNEPTIDYRQHGTNSVGAQKVLSVRYLWKRLSSRKKMRDMLTDAAVQAEVFLRCYDHLLGTKERNLLQAVASTKDKGVLGRDMIYLRYHLLKSGMIRIIPQLMGL